MVAVDDKDGSPQSVALTIRVNQGADYMGRKRNVKSHKQGEGNINKDTSF